MRDLCVARPPWFAPMASGFGPGTDFASLPQLTTSTGLVYEGLEGSAEFNLWSFLAYFAGQFWIIWHSGADDVGEPGQRVLFATSSDGLSWSSASYLSEAPPTGETYYSRGLWVRDGVLNALVEKKPASSDSRALHLYEWDGAWSDTGTIATGPINSNPPLMLDDGSWLLARRGDDGGGSFLLGDLGDWTGTTIAAPSETFFAEPCLYHTAFGVSAVFRDLNDGKRLIRAHSYDGGATWTAATVTNYPDEPSKTFALRLSDGRVIMTGNPARDRKTLVIAVSDNGMVFDRAYVLRGEATTPKWYKSERRIGYQYPHMVEVGGYVYVTYGTNQEDIEVSRVSLGSIA